MKGRCIFCDTIDPFILRLREEAKARDLKGPAKRRRRFLSVREQRKALR